MLRLGGANSPSNLNIFNERAWVFLSVVLARHIPACFSGLTAHFFLSRTLRRELVSATRHHNVQLATQTFYGVVLMSHHLPLRGQSECNLTPSECYVTLKSEEPSCLCGSRCDLPTSLLLAVGFFRSLILVERITVRGCSPTLRAC